MRISATFLTLSLSLILITIGVFLVSRASPSEMVNITSNVITTSTPSPLIPTPTAFVTPTPVAKIIVPKKKSIPTPLVSKVKTQALNVTPVISITPTPKTTPLATTTEILLAATTTENISTSTATTTMVVTFVPLLSGGIAHAGKSVPISYLQITNTGKEIAYLNGFFLQETGSAPDQSIIGLTVVDDRSTPRGAVGGTGASTPFKDGLAFVPVTNEVFAPGQMHLFTIRALLAHDISPYLEKQIVLEVTGIATNAKTVLGQFPIHGTTWTIRN